MHVLAPQKAETRCARFNFVEACGFQAASMERRRLVAKWCIQQNFTGWQDVGEPPTLHWLLVYTGFRLPHTIKGSLKNKIA